MRSLISIIIFAAATSALVSISPPAVHAQTEGSVRGFIRSAADLNRPIANADVMILGRAGARRARANARGFFIVWGLPPGRYNLIALHDGYDPGWRYLCLHAGDDQYVDLQLHRELDFMPSPYYEYLMLFRPEPSQTVDLYSLGDC
ncbi:MAG TPA: carboxypeptidase-like regulatory domain-containing protein [Verrucomicrobiae bacterium]|nr:carboxypeptidase-like regulatory domain-containing protein [Verrucomicrobiae bacterium]